MAQILVANLDEYVAKEIPGVRAAIRAETESRAGVASGVLAAHRHEGHSEITTSYGGVDGFVNLDDTRGDHAALSIEFGRSGRAGRSGPIDGNRKFDANNRGASRGVGALQAAMGAG